MIDRKKVKELKGRSSRADRQIHGLDDLRRIFRGARTAGELLAMDGLHEKYSRLYARQVAARRGKPYDPNKPGRMLSTKLPHVINGRQWMWRGAPDDPLGPDVAYVNMTALWELANSADVEDRDRLMEFTIRMEFYGALLKARALPPDTPLDEHFWESIFVWA